METEELPGYVYGVRYSLTMKGKEFMAEYNPRKYGKMRGLTMAPKDYDIRKAYRQSLLSESRAMSELAGYSVHILAKPHLSILSSLPISTADRPAFSAFSAFTASVIPERFQGYENSYFNCEAFQYYKQNMKRTPHGYEHYDAKQYFYRETPIGCFYTLPELQTLAEVESECRGGSGLDQDRMRYTRMSGLLFTGHGSYRVYNTERTAPKIRVNGERNASILLSEWSSNIYKGSLTVMRDDGNGEAEYVRVSPEIKGSILFGDETHRAAVSVLSHTIRSSFGNTQERSRSILNYNLHAIPNTYYLPVIREAIPLYEIMLYPHWPVWGVKMGKDYLALLDAMRSEAPHAERSEAPTLTRNYVGEVFPHGELSDGSFLAVMTPLHLDSAKDMIESLTHESIRYTVLAMEWQRPFFARLMEEITPEYVHKLKIIYMPQSYLVDYAGRLHEAMENPYFAKQDAKPPEE